MKPVNDDDPDDLDFDDLEPVRAESAYETVPPMHGEDEDHDDDDDLGDAKLGHRGIPTWEEALSVIIDANMEARAKNPQSGQSRGRGRGWGRGKPRH